VFIAARAFILFLLSFTGVCFAQGWKELRTGIEQQVFVLPQDSGSKLEVNVVRINPAKYAVRVVDTYGTLTRQHVQYPVYTIGQIAPIIKPLVMINGGFASSYTLPIPAGLLVDNNRVVTRLNTLSKTQSGVLCIKGSSVRILRKEQYVKEDCVSALQAGPLLLDAPGKLGISQAERAKKFRRSFVATDGKGNLIMGVTNEASLHDLAKFLAKAEPTGIQATAVLNLSGDIESALYVKTDSKEIIFGMIDVPVASTIAILAK
jgi:uncharacterized protein YigE (DUF2233 family)